MNKTIPFLLPVRSLLFIAVFVIGAAVTGQAFADITNWWTIVATAVNFLTIGILVLVARKDGKTYKELINYEKGKTKIKDVVITVIVVYLVGMGVMYLTAFILYGTFMPSVSAALAAPVSKPLAILVFLLLPVTTALAEDGLYIGYGVNRINNKAAAIIVPAFFFALQHSFIPLIPDARYMLYRFFSFLPLTVILSWNYYMKRNPLPIMVGHALIDLATVILVLCTSFDPALYETMLENCK